MSTINLTEEQFGPTVSAEGVVLVDWWASWCGPCLRFGPVYEEASKQHPDVVFAKVDTEAEQHLSALAGIQSIPTLMAFRENVLVFRQAGALPPAALEDLITQVKALDMEEVHAKVAAAQQDGE